MKAEELGELRCQQPAHSTAEADLPIKVLVSYGSCTVDERLDIGYFPHHLQDKGVVRRYCSTIGHVDVKASLCVSSR